MGSKSEHQHPIGADFWTFSNGRLDVYICSPRLERGHRGDAVLTRGKAQAFPLGVRRDFLPAGIIEVDEDVIEPLPPPVDRRLHY